MKTILAELNEKVISTRLKQIEEVSLEVDEYNELYLALKSLESVLWRAIRAEAVIEKKQEESVFWLDMKKLRKNEKEL